MALITKIKEYRERAGYKQSELAEMVGARRETIAVSYTHLDVYKRQVVNMPPSSVMTDSSRVRASEAV